MLPVSCPQLECWKYARTLTTQGPLTSQAWKQIWCYPFSLELYLLHLKISRYAEILSYVFTTRKNRFP